MTYSRRLTAAVLGLVVVALPASASASLGGDAASVQLDVTRLNGTDSVVEVRHLTAHEIRLPGGTVVREYLSPGGQVFALTWRGPFRPDLEQLLGSYFGEFRDAAFAAKSRRTGRAPVVVETPDLVVHVGGRARAFTGRAFVPGLVPAGLSVGDLP
jgi:hypothetical protein